MARVLVVDHSQDLQEALRMLLGDAGFDVMGAIDGARGLEMTRELHPDVILLEMVMPEMDGLEFLSRLSALPGPPPVVAYSGFDAFRPEALRRGALAFLVKPVSPEKLIRALRSSIERRTVESQLVAENAADVEELRRVGADQGGRAVASLDAIGMSTFRDGLHRIVRWLSTYFGFGTSLVHVLRGKDLCVEAFGPGPLQLREGMRYPREYVYCDDVIAAGSPLVLTDPAHHPLDHYAHHKGIELGGLFYAGVPLTIAGGAVLGTLCLIHPSAHEFRREDLRVLEALGLATARAFETRKWPLDEDGVFGREFLDLFEDTLLARAGRPCGAGIAAAIEAHAPTPTARGLAVVGLDAQRRVLIWGGEAGTWAPPDAARLLGRVEISEQANRARLRALCA